MSYITVEVDIDHGKIVAREPEKLPDVAKGLLTVFTPGNGLAEKRERVALPLIKGDGKHFINPTSAEIDASLWGE